MQGRGDYLRARDVEAAVKALAAGPCKILAGGTDVFPALQDRPLRGAVLDISGIDELARIMCDGRYWWIGAGASWTDVVKADLPPAFDGLKAAAREVGSVQIQNRATLVGNLCNASPAADGVPPLMTLDAEIELASVGGRRYLPLGDFILGNRKTALGDGEMVTAVRIPCESAAGRSGFVKLGARRYLVISIGMVAARVDIDPAGRIARAAVAIGACSAVAMRMSALESALTGLRIETAAQHVTPAHFTGLSPIDDVRASAAYRRQAAMAAVRRLLGRTMLGASSGGVA
jgi:CO/xanthine dehydrogenase FAD-binding subunit